MMKLVCRIADMYGDHDDPDVQAYPEYDVSNTCPCDQSFWYSPCNATNANWSECWIWSICSVWNFKHAGECTVQLCAMVFLFKGI
jgi:hypothetical protein